MPETQGSGYGMNGAGARSIARNARFLFGAKILGQGLRAIYVVTLARLLGPELYGLFAHGQAWYLAFLPATMLGIAPLLAKEVGRDRFGSTVLVGQTLTLKLVATMIVALLCGGLGWLFGTDPLAQVLALVFAAALLARGISSWNEQVFAAFEASRYTLGQERVFRPLEVVLGLLLLNLGAGVLAVASLHAILWGLQATRGLLIVRRALVPARPRGRAIDVLRIFRQGLPMALSMFLIGWMVQGPLVLYGYHAGTDDRLGQLALAFQTFYVAIALPSAIAAASLPVLSRAVSRGDGKDMVFLVTLTRVGVAAGAVAGILGHALGPWLVAALFRDRYAESGYLLGSALWLLIPYAIGNTAVAVLAAQGRYAAAAVSSLVGAVVMSATAIPLGAALGGLGTILSAGCGMSIWAIVSMLAASHRAAIGMGQSLLRPLAASIVAISATVILAPLNASIALVAGIGSLVLAYVAQGLVCRSDLAALIRTLRR